MIPLEFDRQRNLHFNLGSIRDLERAGGKPLAAILHDLFNLGIDCLATTLYHGLKHEDATLNAALLLKMLEKHIEEDKSLSPLFTAAIQALEETGVLRTPEDIARGKSKTLVPTLT